MDINDYADQEVKGLARLTPTRLSGLLVAALVTVPFAVFFAVQSNVDWFVSIFGDIDGKLLIPLTAAAISMLAVALLLILEYALLLTVNKHRRITQYSNLHPQLSARWLLANMGTLHWLSIAALATGCVFCGYAIGKI